MAVTTDQVKELRAKTGISVMQCKKALEESDGDAEKALIALRKIAGAQVDKKADRELGAGVVEAYIHNNREVGAIVVLSCETDFVAKNEEFVKLAREIAMQVVATNPNVARREDVDEEELSKLKEVFEKEAGDKPADVKEKIIAGKLDAYFKEIALLEQPHIKDGDKTIKDLLDEAVQKFGERVELTHFCRYSAR